MILGKKSLIDLFKLIQYLNRALALLVGCAFLLILYGICQPFKKKELTHQLPLEKPVAFPPAFDYEKMGKGPLALFPEGERFPIPDLKERILFLGKTTRPDASPSKLKCQIYLRDTFQSLQVPSEETVYLVYDQKGLSFSQKKTCLWLKPRLTTEGKDRLEVGLDWVTQEGETDFSTVQIWEADQACEAKKVEEVKDCELKEGGLLLSKGEYWSEDQFFKQYGGEEFQQYKYKRRFAILGSQDDHILYVQKGDTFIWKEKKWVPCSETAGYLMAKVVECDDEKIEWQLWNREGMESACLSFTQEKLDSCSHRSPLLFKNIKKKTATHVSCKMEGQSLLLKEGDWLIHLSNGWRLIKNLRELEAFLHFDLKGELFIFDAIEKGGGAEFVCGTLFNESRTHAQSIRHPISGMKKREDSPHLKNLIFTKINP